jgi:hypothetical protein
MSHSDYVMTDQLHLSIPTVYVINLDHRADRWELMKKTCNTCGIFPNRVSAVKASPGAVGCGLSHAKVANMAAEKKEPWYLVLEDDATFTNDQWAHFIKLLPILWKTRKQWDVFTGGPNVKLEQFNLIQKDPVLYSLKTWASHFWLVNSNAYETIKGWKASDSPIDVFVEERCKLWSTYPFIAYQAVSPSDINPGYAPENPNRDIKNIEIQIKGLVDKGMTDGFLTYYSNDMWTTLSRLYNSFIRR